MVLSAVLFRQKTTVAAFFALSVAFFIYMQYWSFYFLAIAWHFIRTRQMRYEFGELTTPLKGVLAFIGAWGLVVFGVALRIWISRHRTRQAKTLGER